MSLDTVLNYPPLADIRAKLAQFQATALLRAFYKGYDGHLLPSERETYFRKQFAAHSPLPAGDPNEDEVRAFASTLCHAIWVEDHAGFPWSLNDYSRHEIRFLLERYVPMAKWGYQDKGEGSCWGVIYGTGQQARREPFADEWYKLYPLSFSITGRAPSGTGGARVEAAKALVSWVMSHFFHAYGSGQEDWGWDRYGPTPRHLLSPKHLFHERIVGCHHAAKTLAALLRSVNIPATELDYDGHGVCYLPSLGRYVHGDYLADYAILRDDGMLLMTLAELEVWLKKPRGHTSLWDELQTSDPFWKVRLRRRARTLFVAHRDLAKPDGPPGIPALEKVSEAHYHDLLRMRLPDYRIHEVGGDYYCHPLPIRELDELPACGLALEIDKDANGFVVITIENRGTRRPSNAGLLLIEIDGVMSGGYDLPNIGQGFVSGGGRTEVRTNFQIGANQDGIVRATLTRLPAPCRELIVQRHLGRPLTAVPPGTVVPLVVTIPPP